MSTIYIIFTRPKTVVSKLISLYTKFVYSHVSISMAKKIPSMYSFGRRYKYSIYPGGFIEEKPDFGLYRFDKYTTECKIAEITVTDKQKELLQDKLNKFISNKKYYTYNYLGIIGIIFNVKLNHNNSYFCSQFVCNLLHDVGIDLIKKPIYFAKPQDILKSEKLNILYEGDLKTYIEKTRKTKNVSKVI